VEVRNKGGALIGIEGTLAFLHNERRLPIGFDGRQQPGARLPPQFHTISAGFQASPISRRLLAESVADSAIPEPSVSRFDAWASALRIQYGSRVEAKSAVRYGRSSASDSMEIPA
jgi:hypothetical protein